ncbi:hypothetical protein GA0116948_10853 [Chitinophaga costaii]|uniref:Uncharacterized protein n=1 Tax=Chitinophaga costaii TaxID=1335309 RepID=A0A1C4EER8_9BACT|nr:hypothetical protein [Chitinophaga costaii]PUZ23873.1 hypothetical protein DCM91_13865 [Chitinophaga costaii]SCC42054.1 hypothetical protein GA0116948_10853 [Chitinophaga costaii]
MKNIEKSDPFAVSTYQNNMGIVTILTTETAVSTKDNISFDGKTLLANYVYNDHAGDYNLHYTLIDTRGKTESYLEEAGILPHLFFNPEQKMYVSLIQIQADKEQAISLPVFNREKIDPPKADKSFTGTFIGVTTHAAIFYDVDLFSDTRPDKLLTIEYNQETIKKKWKINISLPKKNKTFLSGNDIHLLAKEGDGWLHRQIDEKGNENNRRILISKTKHFLQVFFLSFEKDSLLLKQDSEKLLLEKWDAAGNISTIHLLDFPDAFYNTWRPVNIAASTYVIQFNTEYGNGWLTIRQERVIELFYRKGMQNYENILSGEIWETEEKNLIIAGINKTTDHAYAVIFYPKAENTSSPNNRLILLNRQIASELF